MITIVSHALLQVSEKELSVDNELVLLLVKIIEILLLIFLRLPQLFVLFMLSLTFIIRHTDPISLLLLQFFNLIFQALDIFLISIVRDQVSMLFLLLFNFFGQFPLLLLENFSRLLILIS